MDFKKSTGFVIFIYLITSVATQGPDPWDETDKSGPIKFDTHKANKYTDKSHTDCLGDLFYKKILKLIITRGHFKENSNGLHETSLHFVFSESDFLMLNKLSTLTVSLTPAELRTMDGILSHAIIEPHYLQIVANNVFEILWMWMMTYYLHGIFLIALVVCIYNLRKVNWSIVFTVRAIVILIIIVSIVWECYEVYQEADNEIFEKMNDEKLESGIFSYFTRKSKINVPQASKYLHPVNILSRLISKLIFVPLKELMMVFDGVSSNITEKMIWPYSTIMYTGLTVIYYSLVIMLLTSFTLYFILGKIPTSLSFFGMKINFANKNRNQNDDNNPEMQTPAPITSNNDDLKASLTLCSNLVDLLRSKENSTKNPKEINDSESMKSVNNKRTSINNSKRKYKDNSSESESKSNHASQPANVSKSKHNDSSSESESESDYISRSDNEFRESDFEANLSSDENILVIRKIRKRPILSDNP